MLKDFSFLFFFQMKEDSLQEKKPGESSRARIQSQGKDAESPFWEFSSC